MLDKNIKFFGDSRDESCLALGRQLAIEYYACGAEALLDTDRVERALLKAARDSGATIISSSFHRFEPQGVSGVVVIAESHFTVHAWPEHNYAAVDIFTCGDNIDLEVAIDSMKASFESENVVISSDQNRGILARPMEPGRIGEIIQNPDIVPISWKKEYETRNPWGMTASIDVYDSDPQIIRDKGHIQQFVRDLCDLIGVERSGDCRIVPFGGDDETEGLSMTQWTETASISGHIANVSNRVYLDVFCCRFYEPREVAEFALSFFRGHHYKMQVALRQ